jgi:hypothetical protein
MISFKEKDFFCFTFSFREAEKSRKKKLIEASYVSNLTTFVLLPLGVPIRVLD